MRTPLYVSTHKPGRRKAHETKECVTETWCENMTELAFEYIVRLIVDESIVLGVEDHLQDVSTYARASSGSSESDTHATLQ